MKNLFFLTFFLFSGYANAQIKITVYFDSDKSELRSDALKVLDSLAADLKEENNYALRINGYCDNTGDGSSNYLLSENRANEVVKYLKNKNVSFNDSESKGFGETNPVADNGNEKGKAKNRRVEIIIIKDTVINAPAVNKKDSPDPVIKEAHDEKSTLTDLEMGKTMVLKNLNFEGGTAILLPEGKPTLEMLLRTMQDNPTLEIEIGGHVCCKDDMPLSILRAQTVYNYLARKGIARERMTYKGYSRNKPIVKDDSDEANARLNRRVEITVIRK